MGLQLNLYDRIPPKLEAASVVLNTGRSIATEEADRIFPSQMERSGDICADEAQLVLRFLAHSLSLEILPELAAPFLNMSLPVAVWLYLKNNDESFCIGVWRKGYLPYGLIENRKKSPIIYIQLPKGSRKNNFTFSRVVIFVEFEAFRRT